MCGHSEPFWLQLIVLLQIQLKRAPQALPETQHRKRQSANQQYAPMGGNVNLLHCVLMLPDRQAENKLDGAPQTVELAARVYVHDTVGRGETVPNRVIQEVSDPNQHCLEHRQTAAKPLPSEQVPLRSNVCLLHIGKARGVRLTSAVYLKHTTTSI